MALTRLLKIIIAFVAGSVLIVRTVSAQGILSGADVSSLLDIEKAGGVFRDRGEPGDEIKILRSHGCQLFRVRLFVHPHPDFHSSDGATQNLQAVRELGKRIKASGGQFLLDIHYSDTWADPGHQIKPAEWKSLDLDGLKQRVADYTHSTISDLQSNDAAPDMVQVGNEITSGILWPDARLSSGPKDQEPQQWQNFSTLLAAGCDAVRAAQTKQKPIRIVLHIHGGGREGLPQWFFKTLMANGGNKVDFDVIGLSFYPAWKDSIENLKKNMVELINTYHKDVLLAETAYAWAPVTDIEGRESMEWPMSKAGQLQFLEETRQVLLDAPEHRGLGYIWWYSDSIPVPDKSLHIWREGHEALFDNDGEALPVLSAFSMKSVKTSNE